MNAIERAIEALSPRWAAARAYYRWTLTQSRAYDAAKTGRRTDNWIAAGTSANAEIGAAASRIRARTRDLVRNNAWAAAAVRKLAVKTVGTGIVPRLAAARDEVERQAAAREAWDGFAETCDPAGQIDFYGLQQLAMRTMYESGEALVRFLPRPTAWRLPIPLQLQVLEPDYLDGSRSEALAGGGAIVQGVEYDADGRRAAYWLFDEHPGESLIRFTRRGFQSRRVPAAEILHIFDPLRPGQARGVSIFAPVALRLRDVDDYDDAEILRKKVATCFAAFVKRGGGATAPPLGGAGATTDAAGRRIETIQAGRVQYLGLDEEVQFPDPPQAEGYLDFMTHQLHAVGAGVGLPYSLLTGDLRQANYSSMRAGLIDFWDLLDHLQWLVAIPQLCRPVWARFAALQAALGRRDPALPYRAIWTPPRRRWVDPVKEGQAVKDAIRSGLLTWRGAVAEMGEDPDAQLEEIAAANADFDALGVVLDSDPRRVGRAGTAAQPTTDGGTDGEAKEDGGA